MVYCTVTWLNRMAVAEGRNAVDNVIDGTYVFDAWLALHDKNKMPKNPELTYYNKVRKHVLGYGQCKTLAEPMRTQILKRIRLTRRWGVFDCSKQHRNLGGGSNAARWEVPFPGAKAGKPARKSRGTAKRRAPANPKAAPAAKRKPGMNKRPIQRARQRVRQRAYSGAGSVDADKAEFAAGIVRRAMQAGGEPDRAEGDGDEAMYAVRRGMPGAGVWGHGREQGREQGRGFADYGGAGYMPPRRRRRSEDQKEPMQITAQQAAELDQFLETIQRLENAPLPLPGAPQNSAAADAEQRTRWADVGEDEIFQFLGGVLTEQKSSEADAAAATAAAAPETGPDTQPPQPARGQGRRESARARDGGDYDRPRGDDASCRSPSETPPRAPSRITRCPRHPQTRRLRI